MFERLRRLYRAGWRESRRALGASVEEIPPAHAPRAAPERHPGRADPGIIDPMTTGTRGPAAERGAPSERRLATALAAALVVLLAAALRLVALDRLPPGLHFDEAVYGLLAEDIRAGARPVFFGSYTGREPLYMYVMAVVFALVGPSAWAIRLTSALAGIVTVALVFALGRRLFGSRVGLVAALAVALSFWHVVVSRNGYPNVLIPPLEAAAAWCLWRGWARGRARDWALGGALTGLVLYTYLAARFWPVFLAAFVVWAAVAEPRRMRRRAGGVLVAVAAAALVFAPLGLHFVRHPADFWERAEQVLASRELDGPALWAAYARNARETAAGLVGRGDPRWHYNLPGRPMVPGAWGWLLVAGLAVCLARLRDVRYALVPLWIAVMALPGILTLELQPAGQRVFGIVPALGLACGIGAAAVADGAAALSSRLRGRSVVATPAARWRALVALLGLGLLLPGDLGLAGAIPAYRDWAGRLETAHIFHADYAAIARMADRDVAAGRTVVVLSEHYRHPTVAFTAPGLVERLVWADPRHAVPVPARGTADVVYYAPLSYLPEDAPALRWLAAHAAEATRWSVGGAPGAAEPSAAPPPALGGPALAIPDGDDDASGGDDEPRPIATDVLRFVLPVEAGAWAEWARATSEPPDDAIALGDLVAVRSITRTYSTDASHGTDARPAYARNQPAVLAVEWRVLRSPPPGDAQRLVLRMTDAEGRGVAQADADGYLPTEWRAGDRVVQWFALPIERTTPPAAYDLEVRLVDEAGRPLPARTAASAQARAGAPLGSVRLMPEGRLRATEEDVAAAIGRWPPEGDPRAGLALLGADPLPDEPLPPGACFDLTLEWARTGSSDAVPMPSIDALTVFVVPVEDGGGWEARFVEPYAVAPEHPVAAWRERERLRGRYLACLPARPYGRDQRVGVWWDTESGAHWIDVGRVTAAPVERFEAVPEGVDARPEAAFRHPPTDREWLRSMPSPPVELAVLRGIDVAWPDEPGGEAGALVVTAWWQWAGSRVQPARPDVGLQAFVHLVGPDGRLLAQRDEPLGGTGRPLAGWLPDEVVPDRRVLAVPDGISTAALVLDLGIYDPVSGTRLIVASGGYPPGVADRVRLPLAGTSRSPGR